MGVFGHDTGEADRWTEQEALMIAHQLNNMVDYLLSKDFPLDEAVEMLFRVADGYAPPA